MGENTGQYGDMTHKNASGVLDRHLWSPQSAMVRPKGPKNTPQGGQAAVMFKN